MIRKTAVQTSHKTDVINVTEALTAMLRDGESGIVLFSVPHTTAALIVCEDDAELRDDLARTVQNWLADLRPFKHIRKNNPNAEAHIMSATLGTSVTVAVENGRIHLGQYQNILLVELDGPRQREIHAALILR